MSVFSAVVNGQLVPVAPANAVNPPAAMTPVISQGAGANNLPGSPNIMGGATGGAGTTPVASNASSSAASSAPTPGGAAGNVWNLPIWQNPLALTLILLLIGYVILRWVHWSA